MKDKLEVLSIGTQVKLSEDVFGIVIGINIKENNTVYYDVGWWNGSSYTEQLFQSSQVESHGLPAKLQQIGFVSFYSVGKTI